MTEWMLQTGAEESTQKLTEALEAQVQVNWSPDQGFRGRWDLDSFGGGDEKKMVGLRGKYQKILRVNYISGHLTIRNFLVRSPDFRELQKGHPTYILIFFKSKTIKYLTAVS